LFRIAYRDKKLSIFVRFRTSVDVLPLFGQKYVVMHRPGMFRD
jgi:hypothetical protein